MNVKREKVLLKKAKNSLQFNRQRQPELTNEKFQRLIHLLAMSWLEITRGVGSHGLGSHGVRLKRSRPVEEAGKNSLGDINPKSNDIL